MRALRIGQVLAVPARVLSRSLFLVLAIVLAGCAPSGTYVPESWNVGGPQPPVADAGRPRVEMEADGLPAQTPPQRREPSEPDDPREPFSPNYGPRPAPAPAMKAAVRAHLPHDLAARFRRRLASAIGE
jgi:hypothetical protein